MTMDPTIIIMAVNASQMHSADWVRMVSVSLVNLLITSPVLMRSRILRGIRNILEARSRRMVFPLRSDALGTM